MTYINPTVQNFKDYFTRDFPYGTDPETDVLDSDITKAFGQTNFNINPGLFANQEQYTVGYLLLAAHYLVIDLRMSSQGLNGQYGFLEQSKSVGSVSQSFAIPSWVTDNVYMSMLMKTNYGAKYLELLTPQLIGQCFAVIGTTLP